MAQGFTQEEVAAILANIDASDLIDDKTKQILHFAGQVNRQPYKVQPETIAELKTAGFNEAEIFEAVAVTALFNFMDRMADALGAPVEGLQEMMAQMMAKR
ncbi:MAG: hypothetical protein WBG37_22100 [Desulfobacterales bacterium]